MTVITNFNVTRILASYLFGLWSSAFLLGVITVQTYRYYQKFYNDPRPVRWLVAMLWMMQCLELGISSRGVYRSLVPHGISGLFALLEQPWYQSYFGTHGVLVAMMVQTFFLTRFWTISRNLPVTISLVVLVTAALGLGLYIMVRSYMFPNSALETLNAESTAAVIAWLSFAAGADIILAVALALELRNLHTGYSKTDSVLNRVAVYGVATGAVTATLVSIQLLMYAVWNLFEDLIFFGLPLGGVYIATFLANLHTRSSLQRIATRTVSDGIELASRRQPTHVTVTSTVVFRRDTVADSE
ncbi:hypothetical protein DL93DRAFT_2230900 [Clavulina sp. PMI_390]|nr:hypothetical protein DL93DRAFT_2230900 [Clavulina sp. PMI_390]